MIIQGIIFAVLGFRYCNIDLFPYSTLAFYGK